VPTEAEIKKIIELHEAHKSQREIAKEFDKSVGWVNGVLKALNVKTERSATKNATEANITYSRERRLALNDKLFKKLEGFTDQDKLSAQDFKSYLISYGILEDKRSLIEPHKPDSLGVAAIDSFYEDLKREAPKDESKAETEHPGK